MRRCSIVSDGTPAGTRVCDEHGNRIPGVRSVSWHVDNRRPGQVFASIELATSLTLNAEARFAVVDPLDGKLKVAKRIEFEDGSAYQQACAPI
jgi:hypothetical protein